MHSAGPDPPEAPMRDRRRIAVVGVCASGKTRLVDGLRALGYDARQVVQEHSYAPDMWQRMARPDVLILLEASLDTIKRRREASFGESYLAEQRRRLAHAAAHADLIIHTDELTPDQVLDRAVSFLRGQGRDG